MSDASEKKLSARGRMFLRCIGFQLEAEAMVDIRLQRVSGKASDLPAIEDQSNIIDGDIVEDVCLEEIQKLDGI